MINWSNISSLVLIKLNSVLYSNKYLGNFLKEQDMDDHDIYEKAAAKVKAKKRFISHAIAYVGVLALLYTIMKFENGGDFLPVMIVGISWGIGLATHYFKTFGTQHLDFLGFSTNWEEEELEKEIDKLKRNRRLREEEQEERSRLRELDELELKEIQKRPLDRDF